MENAGVVEKFEQSKYLLNLFEERFYALSLDLRSFETVEKLSMVQKQDIKSFRKDSQYFDAFLKQQEDKKSEFWKGVRARLLKREDYSAWKQLLSDARLVFLVCCDSASKWPYNQLLITTEDVAEKTAGVRLFKLRAYKSQEWDMFKAEPKEKDKVYFYDTDTETENE